MSLARSFYAPVGSRLGKYSSHRLGNCLAIVGPADRASRAAHRIGSTADGFRIEVFSDRMAPDGRSGGETDIDRLTTLVGRGHIDHVLLATPVGDHDRIAAVVKRLEGMATDVDLIVLEGSSSTGLRFAAAGDVCIASVLKRPLTPFQNFIKSAVDRAGAFLLLMLIAPLLLSIALLVKLTSPGPVLFRQKRFGLNNEVFEVLKFRTLYTHHADATAWQPVKRLDKRVTPIGKILRALSLDELPQLVNVLKGEMSFIGPRPLPVDLRVEGRLCREFPHYAARHRMRPGISGLAQVNGNRGGMEVAEDLEKRLAHDLTYIDNYSLWLDTKIAISTIFAILRPSNAY